MLSEDLAGICLLKTYAFQKPSTKLLKDVTFSALTDYQLQCTLLYTQWTKRDAKSRNICPRIPRQALKLCLKPENQISMSEFGEAFSDYCQQWVISPVFREICTTFKLFLGENTLRIRGTALLYKSEGGRLYVEDQSYMFFVPNWIKPSGTTPRHNMACEALF